MALNERRVDHGFWAGGEQALEDAIRPRITEAVSKEFAKRLKAAGPVRRFFLRRQMNREIERRIGEQLPDDALY